MSKKRDIGTELCLAAFQGDVERVEALLAEGADVNALGERRTASVSNMTPLWIAVHGAGLEIFGEWRNLCDGISEVFPSVAPHDYADKRERFLRIIALLIGAGADPNKLVHPASLGGTSTALRLAVHSQDLEVVRLLLSNGADPNARSFSVLSKLATKEGRRTIPGYHSTVLHEAVQKGSLSVVEALLGSGANPALADHEGKTPADIAREAQRWDLLELIQKSGLGKRVAPP